MGESRETGKKWYTKPDVWFLLGVIVYIGVRMVMHDPSKGAPT